MDSGMTDLFAPRHGAAVDSNFCFQTPEIHDSSFRSSANMGEEGAFGLNCSEIGEAL